MHVCLFGKLIIKAYSSVTCYSNGGARIAITNVILTLPLGAAQMELQVPRVPAAKALGAHTVVTKSFATI
jgi:hypothetical protein